MANYIITNNGLVNADALSHHGVKGMKWGVRRYQNKDGSLTPAGKKRQAMIDARDTMTENKIYRKAADKAFSTTYNGMTQIHNQLTSTKRKAYSNAVDKTLKDYHTANKNYKDSKKTYKQAKKDFKEQKQIDRFKKHGLDYNLDTAVNVHNHGFKGAKRIEDRIAKTGMSRLKSETIETGRTVAKAAALTIGTVAVMGLAGKIAEGPKMQLRDATGKVIRNYWR